MNGSEKQIKWAEDIRASKASDFAALRSKIIDPKGIKAVDFIESIDAAAFWIDNRSRSVLDMMTSLVRGGLSIKGGLFADKAVMDMASGTITVTTYDTSRNAHTATI